MYWQSVRNEEQPGCRFESSSNATFVSTPDTIKTTLRPSSWQRIVNVWLSFRGGKLRNGRTGELGGEARGGYSVDIDGRVDIDAENGEAMAALSALRSGDRTE